MSVDNVIKNSGIMLYALSFPYKNILLLLLYQSYKYKETGSVQFFS